MAESTAFTVKGVIAVDSAPATKAVGQFIETGKDAAAVATNIGTRLRDASGRFVSAGKGAADLNSNLGRLANTGQGVSGVLGRIGTAARGMGKELSAAGSELQLKLAILTGGFGLFGKAMYDRTSEMQQFEATLTAVTGSAEVARQQLASLTAFAAKTPFELPGVVEAGIKFRSYNLEVQRFLPLAGNLAAVMGRDIPEAAAALAKGASGVQDGITQLAESWNITKRDLIAAGAVMGEQGAIAVSSAGQIKKLQDALERVIQKKFGDAMAQQSRTLKGAFSNLSDSIGQFLAQVGSNLAPMVETFARSVTSVVDAFKALPPAQQEVIAQAVVFTGVFLGVATAMAGVLAAAPLLTTFFGALGTTVGTFGGIVAGTTSGLAAFVAGAGAVATGVGTLVVEVGAASASFGLLGGAIYGVTSVAAAFTSAIGGLPVLLAGISAGMGIFVGKFLLAKDAVWSAVVAATAFLTPLLGLPGALAAAAAGLVFHTAKMNADNKAAEESIKIHERRLRLNRKSGVGWGETGDSLKEEGRTDKDITDRIAALERFRQFAEEQGATEREKRYQEEIERLRKLRSEFAGTEAAKQAAAKQTHDQTLNFADSAVEMATRFEKARQQGLYATKNEEMIMHAQVLTNLENQYKKVKDVDEKRALDLAQRIKQLKEEEPKLKRESRKESADEEMRTLENLAALGKLSKEEEAKQLEALAVKYKDIHNWRRDTEQKAALARRAANENEIELLEHQNKLLEARRQLTPEKQLESIKQQRAKLDPDNEIDKKRLREYDIEEAKLQQQIKDRNRDTKITLAKLEQDATASRLLEIEKQAQALREQGVSEVEIARVTKAQKEQVWREERLAQLQVARESEAALAAIEEKSRNTRLSQLKFNQARGALNAGEMVREQYNAMIAAQREKLAEFDNQARIIREKLADPTLSRSERTRLEDQRRRLPSQRRAEMEALGEEGRQTMTETAETDERRRRAAEIQSGETRIGMLGLQREVRSQRNMEDISTGRRSSAAVKEELLASLQKEAQLQKNILDLKLKEALMTANPIEAQNLLKQHKLDTLKIDQETLKNAQAVTAEIDAQAEKTKKASGFTLGGMYSSYEEAMKADAAGGDDMRAKFEARRKAERDRQERNRLALRLGIDPNAAENLVRQEEQIAVKTAQGSGKEAPQLKVAPIENRIELVIVQGGKKTTYNLTNTSTDRKNENPENPHNDRRGRQEY